MGEDKDKEKTDKDKYVAGEWRITDKFNNQLQRHPVLRIALSMGDPKKEFCG